MPTYPDEPLTRSLIAEELSQHGKQLISVGDNIDTSTSNGKLLFHILY